jgi:hypothetical protein
VWNDGKGCGGAGRRIECAFGLRYSLEQLGGEGMPLGIVGIELATAFDQLLLSEEGGFR